MSTTRTDVRYDDSGDKWPFIVSQFPYVMAVGSERNASKHKRDNSRHNLLL